MTNNDIVLEKLMYLWLKNKFEAEKDETKKPQVAEPDKFLDDDLLKRDAREDVNSEFSRYYPGSGILDIPGKFHGDISKFAYSICGPLERNVYLTRSQETLLRLLAEPAAKKVVCCGSRQSGKTEICMAYSMWRMLVSAHTDVFYFAPSSRIASDVFNRFVERSNKLFGWSCTVTHSVPMRIEIDNGSSFTAASKFPDYYGGSVSNWGKIPDVVICDEFAFFDKKQNVTVLDAFDHWASKNPDLQTFLVSSPIEQHWRKFSDEENLFNKYWNIATCRAGQNLDGWIAYSLTWPRY